MLTSCVQAQHASIEQSSLQCVPHGLDSTPHVNITEIPVRRFKKQAVQNIKFSAGWLEAIGHDDLNTRFVETSVDLGIPLGSFQNILGVTPSFRADVFDVAPTLDVPAELFETGLSFFYRRPIHNQLSAMAILRPSIRSDFTTSDQAFRVFGLGLLNWDYQPELLSLSFGAVYLDRADLPLLPAVGLTWTPKPTVKLDLRFPESKLAWRLDKNGSRYETWSYLTAGIGGNTWAVTRNSGLTDELSLRDIRVIFGIDHVTDGGGGWFAECGYAFNRRIEYEVTATEIRLSDGVLLQAGWRY